MPRLFTLRPPSLLTDRHFRAYLGSHGFSQAATILQTLLSGWLLVGVLLLPGNEVGILQALIGLPSILVMLWGGASADRYDPRRLLFLVYAVAPFISATLIVLVVVDAVGALPVVLWAIGISVSTSFAMPIQQTILNNVAGSQVQRGVSASTAIGQAVQVAALILAGQLDQFGVASLIGLQSLCFILSAALVRRLPAIPAMPRQNQSSIRAILDGFRAIRGQRDIFHVLVINFTSSIFNAGAFMTVFPFIMTRVYGGGAGFLAGMMAVFYLGALMANLLLYRLMPFTHPGRLFLLMQLSRVGVIFLLWINPPTWLMTIAVIGWGLNMGCTTTLARTIVQESSEAATRGRVMSVFTLGMVGSAPIGAVILGFLISTTGTLNALVPSMVLSLVLCAYGLIQTRLWDYQSPAVA
jgi:MFS family permease